MKFWERKNGEGPQSHLLTPDPPQFGSTTPSSASTQTTFSKSLIPREIHVGYAGKMEEIKTENQRVFIPDFGVALPGHHKKETGSVVLLLLAPPTSLFPLFFFFFAYFFTLTNLATVVTMGSPRRAPVFPISPIFAGLRVILHSGGTGDLSWSSRLALISPNSRQVAGFSSMGPCCSPPHRPTLPQSVGKDPEALRSDAT